MTTEGSMQTVELADWHFSFGSDSRLIGTPLEKTPDTFQFATAIELLKYLACDDTHRTAFQHLIRKRLKDDPIVRSWHRNRTPIGSTTHFKCYRDNRKYQTYHDAAAAVSAHRATAAQHELVRGLDEEITASSVLVPAGQMLFHGRGDRNLDSSVPYPSFISTSLDPTVSIYHAVKRQSQRAGARATIYVLTLESPLHAFWGNGGSMDEWELLLQTRLTCTVNQQHEQNRFDIIEAAIGP